MSKKQTTSAEDLRRVGGMSYLNPNAPEPWASFVEQIERVKPHLGHLAKWIETMKHPKRILIVDVPIIRDDQECRGQPAFRWRQGWHPS